MPKLQLIIQSITLITTSTLLAYPQQELAHPAFEMVKHKSSQKAEEWLDPLPMMKSYKCFKI